MNLRKTGKKRIQTLLTICIIVAAAFVPSFLILTRSSYADTYFPPGYNFMTPITIKGSMTNSTLTNFPVLIDITDANLTNHANSDGSDIVFMDNQNNTLNREIEQFNSSSGHLIAWVTIPAISPGVDTNCSMYYCTSTPVSQNSSQTWDPNFMMVQHMEEPSGTRLDSTNHGNNAVVSGTVTKDPSGKIDGADLFTGIGYEKVSAGALPTTSITMELWLKPTSYSTTTYTKFINTGPTTTRGISGGQINKVSDKWYLTLTWNGGASSAILNFVSNYSWNYLAMTWNGTWCLSYLNGAKVGNGVAVTGTPDWASSPLFLGSNSGKTENFNGSIDEVRISNVSRSAGWIQTCYNNQNNASAYVMLGADVQNTNAPSNPVIQGVTPKDGKTGVPLNPTLSAQVTQIPGLNMDVVFSENDTGIWTDLQPAYINVPSATYYVNTTDMTQVSTTYYWSVRASITGFNNWTTESCSFTTTNYQPPPPANLTGSASFLVTTDGVTAYAVNCTSGLILIQSTNASFVINTALASLTPSRTDIQEVQVIGTFMLDSPLTVQSYTRFRLDGTLILAPNLANSTHPDILHGPPKGGTNIELIGGTYDGNRQNGNQYNPALGYWNYNALNCIYFNTALNVLIRDVTAKNAGTVDVHLDSSQNYTLDHVSLLNPGYHGLHNGHNSQNSPIANVTLLNVYAEGPVVQPGTRENDGGAIVGGGDAGYFRVFDCIVNGAYAQGINIGASGYGTPDECLVEGCQVHNVGLAGIEVFGAKTIVTNNIVTNCGRLTYGPNSNVSSPCAGIYLHSNMVYGVVSNNIVTTNSTSGIFIKRECTNVVISDNILQSPYNLGDGITVNGTHLMIMNNKILGFQNAINMTSGGGSFTTIRNNELKPGTNFITTDKPQIMGVVVEWNDVNGSALLSNQSSVQFRYNTGYRTECGGSVTNSTATTFYIQHRLVNTPVFVSVSFNATGFSSKWSANSTTITITIAGAPESSTVTCYYQAQTWYGP